MVDPGDTRRTTSTRPGRSTTPGRTTEATTASTCRSRSSSRASRWRPTRPSHARRRRRPPATCGTTPTTTASASATTARARPGTTRRTAAAASRLRSDAAAAPASASTSTRQFPGWNLDCSDHAVREPEWEREFREFERNGTLPGLEIVYFPNDHTQGTTAGSATPQSYMADNDLALGRLVDAVSHSPYWQSTAIFVVEDDAQDGPDHVDAHRSTGAGDQPLHPARRASTRPSTTRRRCWRRSKICSGSRP